MELSEDLKIEDSCHLDNKPFLHDGDWDNEKQEVFRDPNRVLFPEEKEKEE